MWRFMTKPGGKWGLLSAGLLGAFSPFCSLLALTNELSITLPFPYTV